MMKILVVDDEKKIAMVVADFLAGQGYETAWAISGPEALTQLDGVDLVLADMKMPGMDGMELLKQVHRHSPETDVMIMTAHATVSNAVEAMKQGACDYLFKPFDLEDIGVRIGRLASHRHLTHENRRLKIELAGKYDFSNIIGRSQAVRTMLDLASRVMNTDATVLITGPSGTGKELLARAIHYNGPRANGPFMEINCGALPESLLESELFGHRRGAFTGAIRDKKGLLDVASGGTVLLDEIGDMPLPVQVKLLRVLQNREMIPVGSTDKVYVDARIIAATNMDLENAVRDKRFREDLYYRLAVFPIRVPSLAERRDDIAVLAGHFLTRQDRNIKQLDAEAMNMLESHAWPGNIRELENTIQRACLMAGDKKISTRDLPEELRTAQHDLAGTADSLNLDIVEYRTIGAAIKRAAGNKSEAAKLLGISRRAIYSKMEKHEKAGRSFV